MGRIRIILSETGKFFRAKRIELSIIALVLVVVVLIYQLFRAKEERRRAVDNTYNMAFYQLVDNVQDVEVYLAKSRITNSPEKATETLAFIWREANLAQTYLSMLPISSVELENTAKFLNQTSDYSYYLMKKTAENQVLSQEELDNLGKLHDFSYNLKNTLNQLTVDLSNGKISWRELALAENQGFSKNINNISKENFGFVEENFHEYAGLIYDGAFSEHLTNPEHKGLLGNMIDEETALNKATDVIGKDKIKQINSTGVTNNATIECYDFMAECKDSNLWWISVSKQGGYIVNMNSNRTVSEEKLNDEMATKKAQEFLEMYDYTNMKKTYFSKNNGTETINFAYEQDGVTIYPDLIKVKVALDNGEIMGMETSGYLNSHTKRAIPEVKFSQEEAIKKINSNINISAINLAIIPTEFKTEIFCWEIKGSVDDREFLVYINAENGKEEDILMVLNSSEGTLTM